MRTLAYLTLLGLALAASRLQADPPCLPNVDEQKHAGNPSEISRIAKPTDTGHYTGYYVGGGSPGRLGGPKQMYEGTWGWDYQGFLLPSRVNLQWYHGLFYQGGTGAYKTDGPKVLEHKK